MPNAMTSNFTCTSHFKTKCFCLLSLNFYAFLIYILFQASFYNLLPLSTIIVRCPVLQAPQNGMIMMLSQEYEAEANYSCNAGFILNGVSTRTCGPGGVWTGEDPMCNGM